MAQLAFADVLKAVSLSSWKERIIGVATQLGLPTESWAEGGISRTLVALFSQFYWTLSDVVRLTAASGFLDTAEGAWLTLLAKSLFNVPRIEATYATAPSALRLTNTGGGLFIYEAGDIVAAHSVTGKTYRNTTGGTLNPGAGQTLVLGLIAEEAGSASNAAPGTVTVMVTTSLGVTATNIVALAGLDEETDAQLRQRCRDSVASLTVGGIKRAYEFAARSAKRTDGTTVGVTRVRVMPAPGDGTLTVYVAGASGALDPSDVAAVQTTFDETTTPYGYDATAVTATNLSVTVPCTIWIPSSLGLTTTGARTLVRDALIAYVNTLPIGGVVISPDTGKIYWRALLAVIADAIPGTLKVQLTSEVDVSVADGQVPVFTGALTDTTVNQVS